VGGGALAMDACSTSAESGDGRTVFAITPNGQLKMPRLGNYCVTMLGDGASDVDAARGADVAATSSDPQHVVKSIVDGDAKSYWASALDPTAPVDVQVDFGTSRQIKSIEIEWEHPAQVCLTSEHFCAHLQACLTFCFAAQAFELQVAQAGKWTNVFSTTSNSMQTTKYVGPTISGSALRLRMRKARLFSFLRSLRQIVILAALYARACVCMYACLRQAHPTLGSRDGHML
jgi:hypothetical protein